MTRQLLRDVVTNLTPTNEQVSRLSEPAAAAGQIVLTNDGFPEREALAHVTFSAASPLIEVVLEGRMTDATPWHGIAVYSSAASLAHADLIARWPQVRARTQNAAGATIANAWINTQCR